MKGIEKGCLYWNTIKSLKPIQIKHQTLNRIKTKPKPAQYTLKHITEGIHIEIPELDADEKYLERFCIEGILKNSVQLLHEKHSLNDSWYVPGASHLWNYNLHYLEFLVPLAEKYCLTGKEEYKEKIIEIIVSWIKEAESSVDAYEPYTISMRIPNMLIVMELLHEMDKNLVQKIYDSLYSQYRYLLKNPELGLLANHYFENCKTIIISSILFGELDVYHVYFDLFLKQIKEQILQDGLHYERSLMYHKIILEDILRIYSVLQSFHYYLDAEKLIPTIKIMAEALEGVEYGFDHTPLFNDAGDNVGKPRTALLKVCRSICGEISIKRTTLPDAGYYRLDHGKYAVIFDCGDIGPQYMGGHAHNDCLSFELSINGKVVFTNSGTGQYQGSMRTFFRSAVSHNTIMIDNREPSELWGEHRVARRIRDIRAVSGELSVAGQFKSYQEDCFRRELKWEDNCLIVTDKVKSIDSEGHIVRQFFHLAPVYHFERCGKNVYVLNKDEIIATVRVPQNSDYLIHNEGRMTAYAKDFGRYEKKQVLEIRTYFQKSIQLKILIYLGLKIKK